jgi:glycosyltransferase involved in cell wall biosynthesis
MLTLSDARNDPRVERSARALVAAGYRVKIVCPDHEPPFAGRPVEWGPNVTFAPLPLKVQDFSYVFPWLLGGALYKAASRERPFAFHCHDLNTAVTGLAAAQRTGALCVCDFHEWYSENASWHAATERFLPHTRLKRGVFRFAERLAIRHADAVVTVCQSIAREMEQAFDPSGRRVEVIRNIPLMNSGVGARYGSLREQLGLGQEQQLVLYQGGTGPTRQLEPVIEALAFAPEVSLAIRGPASEGVIRHYRAVAERVGAADRLFLLPPVPSSDVVAAAAASGAIAGVYTVAGICLNWQYALPNKVFEYMAAGLPVLVADYPEVRSIVERYQVGLCFDPLDPRSIGAQLRRLALDPRLGGDCRRNLKAAMADMQADREWHKLVELYDSLATQDHGRSIP